ncbi:uncharacterized protein EI90DRAFT_3021950 [Cantharellus anzutake]|uniref:uncharacterized protein n=1 Tax=Cantharellus anzutake TaxID=1750568 RepID=UPI0019061DF0|nr:uncharacterized protein EI90DRAFT_3021950 [Cantharellus anzutake]KAF8315298.1 hypothetical protein EI90DRAFT_3021950 [Cantharellus anzutake]
MGPRRGCNRRQGWQFRLPNVFAGIHLNSPAHLSSLILVQDHMERDGSELSHEYDFIQGRYRTETKDVPENLSKMGQLSYAYWHPIGYKNKPPVISKEVKHSQEVWHWIRTKHNHEGYLSEVKSHSLSQTIKFKSNTHFHYDSASCCRFWKGQGSSMMQLHEKEKDRWSTLMDHPRKKQKCGEEVDA